jgi:hypothetical protein
MLNFEELKNKLNEEYSDDARFSIEEKDGKIYFLYSDHHNDKLYVLIAPGAGHYQQDLQDYLQDFVDAVVAKGKEHSKEYDGTVMEYGGLSHTIEQTMKDLNATFIGH